MMTYLFEDTYCGFALNRIFSPEKELLTSGVTHQPQKLISL